MDVETHSDTRYYNVTEVMDPGRVRKKSGDGFPIIELKGEQRCYRKDLEIECLFLLSLVKS